MSKIDVLDHGFVRLVDSMGDDLAISRAARVSYNADWRAGEAQGSDARLINYLWEHKHTSPFESVTLTFEVKAPIFVLRQWHRHRTWAYNEISARYTELPSEWYLPRPEIIGAQSKSNKQGRELDPELVEQRTDEVKYLNNCCQESYKTYENLLTAGWPRELARMVLPVNMYSRMFATVNLLNLFRFCTLRSDPHAQFEIRVFSDALIELAKTVAPIAVAAWEKEHHDK